MTKYALSIAIVCLMAAMPLAGHAKSLVDRHIDSLITPLASSASKGRARAW